MIGCGTKRGNLYCLDLRATVSDKLRQVLAVNESNSAGSQNEIWVQHQRLGHASFGYMKKLFPSLFGKIDIFSMHCDICELAKKS